MLDLVLSESNRGINRKIGLRFALYVCACVCASKFTVLQPGHLSVTVVFDSFCGTVFMFVGVGVYQEVFRSFELKIVWFYSPHTLSYL